MSTQVSVIENDLQWRVIGNWSAQDADNGQLQSGAINYGFTSQESALCYIKNLCSIAMQNDMYVRTEFARLDVSAAKWSKFRNFNASYRVAQYLN